MNERLYCNTNAYHDVRQSQKIFLRNKLERTVTHFVVSRDFLYETDKCFNLLSYSFCKKKIFFEFSRKKNYMEL